MNIRDIEDFRLSDAVEFHSELNPLLFTDDKLQKQVRDQLMIIAHDFVDFMGVQVPKVVDVRLYGSNAAYTYTKHSDIDLHILVDMDTVDNDEVYLELFNSKKKLFNDTMKITVRGLPVELYMQNSEDVVRSLGDYSVLHDRWVKMPTRSMPSLNDHATREKFKRLVVLAELALRGEDLRLIDELLATIRRYRQAGLEEGGEFSPENFSVKALRSRGILDKLYDYRDALKGRSLSIDEALPTEPAQQEDNPLMAKFKRFMESSTNWKFAKSNMSGFQIEQAYWARQSRLIESGEWSTENFQPYLGLNDYIECARSNRLMESESIDQLQQFQKFLKTKDGRRSVNMRVGSSVSVMQFTPLSAFNTIQVTGFKTPKKIKNINKNVDGDINWIEFTDGSYFPDAEFHHDGKGGEWSGVSTLFFKDSKSADYARVLIELHNIDGNWKLSFKNYNDSLKESSGYIPSQAERNDPRFKMALSVDIDPNIMPRQAKAMGLGKIKRDGRPQVAKTSGKFTR